MSLQLSHDVYKSSHDVSQLSHDMSQVVDKIGTVQSGTQTLRHIGSGYQTRNQNTEIFLSTFLMRGLGLGTRPARLL